MSDNELLLAISNIVQSQVEPLKNEIQRVETSLRDEIKEIRLSLENDVIPRLENIEDCYVSTFNKYSESFNKIEAIQSDVDMLKKVVAEHSEKLQKIS